VSIAAAQATKFYEQVVAEGRLFTFTQNDEYLIYPIEGKEVVPFWSSKTRLESIQAGHPKYQKYQISEVSLERFLKEDLQLLEGERLSVGVNWSGARLTGYDISAQDLRKNIEYWQSKGAA
jgi:hypothetical protein